MTPPRPANAIDGSFFFYDDELFWPGKLQRNVYELVGRKELLCGRHQDMKKITRGAGQGLPCGFSLERCSTLAVAVVNNAPEHATGKQVWYVDSETYEPVWIIIYDRAGRAVKCYLRLAGDLKTATGDAINFTVGSAYVDAENKKSGFSDQTRLFVPEISKPFDAYGPFIFNFNRPDY
jgi:hypothetical protein